MSGGCCTDRRRSAEASNSCLPAAASNTAGEPERAEQRRSDIRYPPQSASVSTDNVQHRDRGAVTVSKPHYGPNALKHSADSCKDL
ncbi:uncharacterized [Tachysurus ichikawai]